MNMEYTSYRPVRLSSEEITKLVKEYKETKNEDILDIIINSCFIIVKSIVNKYHKKCANCLQLFLRLFLLAENRLMLAATVP